MTDAATFEGDPPWLTHPGELPFVMPENIGDAFSRSTPFFHGESYDQDSSQLGSAMYEGKCMGAVRRTDAKRLCLLCREYL